MFDQVIFKNKKFSDILEEIYKDTKIKEKQVNQLISELKPLIQDTGDATLVVPLIKEYLEIGIKNSDNLIKMAAICQRLMAKQVEMSDGGIISEEEKEALLSAIEDIEEEQQKALPAPKIINMPK
jgi:DNA-binding winged helix-turn-helix (wHTH) protein